MSAFHFIKERTSSQCGIYLSFVISLLLVLLIVFLTSGLVVADSANSTTQSPTAEFEITPEEQVPDEEVTIDASESTAPSGEIVEYDWSYEVSTTSWDQSTSGVEFSNEWTNYGEYDITLTVTDSNGESDSTTKTVEITGEGPTAEFEITPEEQIPDEEVTIDASESTAPSGEIVEYDWSYEVSTTSWDQSTSGVEFSNEWTNYGEYEITLTVTDNGGKSDSTTKTVEITGEGPTAEFEITPEEPVPGEEVMIDASESVAPSGEIVEYDWSYEVPTTSWDQSTSGVEFSNEWGGYGEFDITLTVTDNGGKSDSATKTIDVGGDGPTANFDLSSSTLPPNQEVVFDASDSETTAGSIETYEWEYETIGGNVSASGESLSHSFGDYGEFSITLTVTGEYGRSDSISEQISITGEGPTADFESSPSDPELNERIVFDGSVSTEPDLTIEEYQWYINGEPQGTESELDVVFDEAGVYNVELEVENTGGKADRVSESLRVGDEADIIDNPDFEIVRSQRVADVRHLLLNEL